MSAGWGRVALALVGNGEHGVADVAATNFGASQAVQDAVEEVSFVMVPTTRKTAFSSL